MNAKSGKTHFIAVEEPRLYGSLYIAGIQEKTDPLKTWSIGYMGIKCPQNQDIIK